MLAFLTEDLCYACGRRVEIDEHAPLPFVRCDLMPPIRFSV